MINDMDTEKVTVFPGVVQNRPDKHCFEVLMHNECYHPLKLSTDRVVASLSSIIIADETEGVVDIGVVTVGDDCDIEKDAGPVSIVDLELGDHLSEDQKDLIKDILVTHEEAFTGKGVGLLDVAPYNIELMDYTPIYQRPRRFPEVVNKEIESQLDELKDLGIIEPSMSGWSSPIVPIRKKDGSIRLCIDYRQLNAVTKTDRFPLPNLTDAVFGLHGMKYFSTLDMVKGYYQVPLSEESKDLTSFRTPRELLRFNRMPFGLKNAPACFQRVMQDILGEFPWSKVMVYIDDVLILSENFDQHLELVGRVLATLNNYGVRLNLKKCNLFCQEVEFLGHMVSAKGLRKPDHYIKQVLEFQKPETREQLRAFLGLINFQRKFVKDCSLVMKPLSRVTGGKSKEKVV